MKILRILGYVAAFVIILLVVNFVLTSLLDGMGAEWPEMLSRAVTVILTWAIFWVAVWRPMGRRMARAQNAQSKKKQTPGSR